MLAFNPYNLRARIQPFLLAWFPILAMPLALIPDASLGWTAVRWIALSCVFAPLLTQLGRDSGKRLEWRIHRDKMPSIAMLRHRDMRLDQHSKERYLSFLSENIRGLQLPSFEEERDSPDKADERYRSAVFWLLAQTTNREQFPLVFEESVSYGFRRNMWAQKRKALWCNAIALTLVVAGCSGHVEFSPAWLNVLCSISPLLFLWAAAALAHSLFFVFVIKRRWVRKQSETFARRLLAACDQLETAGTNVGRYQSAAKR